MKNIVMYSMILIYAITISVVYADSIEELCGEEICSDIKIVESENKVIYMEQKSDEFYSIESNQIYKDMLPEIIHDTMPNVLENFHEQNTEDLAEKTMFNIFDIVEFKIIDEGTGQIFDKFGGRILELVANGFTRVFERTGIFLQSHN